MQKIAAESQPARMRCGKDALAPDVLHFLFVATRTNALWQRYTSAARMPSIQSQPARMRCGKEPSGESLALKACRNPHECAVAKLRLCFSGLYHCPSQPARMRCGKEHAFGTLSRHLPSQPARMRCGKVQHLFDAVYVYRGRNPHECAVAKASTPEQVNAIKVATRTNALWQRTLKAI